MSFVEIGLESLPGGLVTEDRAVAGRIFRVTRPRNPDLLLDEPAVREANRSDDYMPYWGYLWPAGELLAEAVLTHPLPPGDAVIEIGCGIGLVGLAALAAGRRVTFSDYDATALALASYNARQNGFDKFETLRLDWRESLHCRFPVVLAGDLLYEARNHAPLVALLDAMLESGGVAWFSDPHRRVSRQFVCMLAPRFTCRRKPLIGRDSQNGGSTADLYVIERA